MPPFPPPEFFYRIGVAIRSWGMTPTTSSNSAKGEEAQPSGTKSRGLWLITSVLWRMRRGLRVVPRGEPAAAQEQR